MTTNFPYNDVLAALVELSRLRSEHAAEPDADVQDAIQVDIDKLECLLRQEFSHNPLLNNAVDRYLNASKELMRHDAAPEARLALALRTATRFSKHLGALARGKIQAGKEHHVVPQLYLRHFRSDPGEPTGSACAGYFVYLPSSSDHGLTVSQPNERGDGADARPTGRRWSPRSRPIMGPSPGLYAV